MPNPIDFATLTPDRAREALPRWLADHITDAAVQTRVARALSDQFASWSDEQIAAQVHYVAHAAMGEAVREAEPTCRLVSRTWADHIALPGEVTGLSHLHGSGANPFGDRRVCLVWSSSGWRLFQRFRRASAVITGGIGRSV